MNTNDAEILEQQRQRRKRINRMKTGIVLTIAIWMIVSLLAIMILTVQVIKLNSKVYILEIQQTSKVSTSEEDASKDAEVSVTFCMLKRFTACARYTMPESSVNESSSCPSLWSQEAI